MRTSKTTRSAPGGEPPRVLLDVGPVLYAVSGRGDPAVRCDWTAGEAVTGGSCWPILWSATVAVATVVTTVPPWRQIAEVGWLTSWRQAAASRMSRVLNLPAFNAVRSGREVALKRPPQNAAEQAALAQAPLTGSRSALTGRRWTALTPTLLAPADTWLRARCAALPPSSATPAAPGVLS
jgi:hypothetical protein